MYFGGIWIKAIAEILLAVLAVLCALYAYKKLNWKPAEFSFCVIISLTILITGFVTMSHAVAPNIQQATVHYLYQDDKGVVFGRTYYFVDEKDKDYNLTMDPFTSKKLLGDNELDQNTLYTITYEAKSETIIGIDDHK